MSFDQWTSNETSYIDMTFCESCGDYTKKWYHNTCTHCGAELKESEEGMSIPWVSIELAGDSLGMTAEGARQKKKKIDSLKTAIWSQQEKLDRIISGIKRQERRLKEINGSWLSRLKV